MTSLELTAEEFEILQEEIESRRSQLEREILHTENSNFKMLLKKRLETLTGLSNKLQAPAMPA